MTGLKQETCNLFRKLHLVILLLAIAGPMAAQNPSLSLAGGSGAPGSLMSLDISLSANGGASPAGMQWTLNYTPADFSSVSVDIGAAATAAGKMINCSNNSGAITCVVVGLNATTISDGIVGIARFQIAAGTQSTSSQISFSNVSGTTSIGDPLVVTASGNSIAINQSSGGGSGALAGISCAQSSIVSGTSTLCTVSLTGVAPSGGVSVTVLSNSSVVTIVPGTVLIQAGQSSGGFSAAAGATSTDLQVTLQATLSGSSVMYTLTVRTQQSRPQSVSCIPPTVFSGNSSFCTVTMNNPVSAPDFTVQLSSNNQNVVVPPLVSIPQGASTGSFTADVGAITAAGTALISASANGVAKTATLSILPPGQVSLSCAPSALVAPATASCTINLGSPASAPGVMVSLTSSSNRVTIPVSVNIPTGVTTAIFSAKAAAAVTSSTPILITSSVGASTTLTLLPTGSDTAVTALSCTPQTLTGAGSATCQVTIAAAAPSGGLNVLLTASGSQVSVPQSVQILQGVTSAQFNIGSTFIDRDETSTLTATLGTAKQSALTLVAVKPVSLACAPKKAHSGSPVNCQVLLNSAQTNGLISIGLASNNSHVLLPASMNVQAKQGSVIFQAPTTYVSDAQSVILSASYHGVSVQDTLTLTSPAPILIVPGRQNTLPGKLTGFSVSASDPTGLPVSISVTGLPVNASFNSATGIFTWTPQTSDIGLHYVRFTATNTSMVSTTDYVPVYVGSDTPVITNLANAANYVDDGGCSPGALGTLMGAGFRKIGEVPAGSVPLPTEVGGVRVKANAEYLPILYVSENQVNFQCPVAVPGEALTIAIESDTGVSPPLSRKIQAATPGLFSIDGSGKGQGAILIANTPYVAMPPADGLPTQRALPGDLISIYANGLGDVDAIVPIGQAAPLDTPVHAKLPIDVVIGGLKAEVSFAGLGPGYIGVFAVTATVPSAVQPGDDVPVQLRVHLPDGRVITSNYVTIAVAAGAN